MEYEIKIEPMLTVRKNGVLRAVVSNDLGEGPQTISECQQLSQQGLKELLESLIGKKDAKID